ncbi:hypothetical protein [Curtobacterium sp. C2H10]|jgi:hypothetical protein|uniref:hypothetical protein n=1 Tax=Curtobacterium sp. C2H10 TaxID=2736664 RepID=UPI0021BF824A|nr:hypothetical protein [Curtobacterium sp. C2H10]MCT9620368.1 hypothetical protein [Curtobacterium sp. C2H10]
MTESDQSHESWDQRVTRMAETTDQWSIRTNDAPPILPGSALGGDDHPGLHVSGIAWYAMVVAVEHLEFTFSAMRATGTLYPTAQMTALRTALLTGSQAVWVLAPTLRAERRAHAMRLQMQDSRDELAMVRGLSALDATQAALRAETEANLEQRQVDRKNVATKLALPSSAVAKLNNTDVIAEASSFVHPEGNQTLNSGVSLLWRMGSAAAHGQRSYAVTRAGRNERRTDGRDTIVELRGDLARDIGPSAAAAVLTVSEAFRLFDLRNGGAR